MFKRAYNRRPSCEAHKTTTSRHAGSDVQFLQHQLLTNEMHSLKSELLPADEHAVALQIPLAAWKLQLEPLSGGHAGAVVVVLSHVSSFGQF